MTEQEKLTAIHQMIDNMAAAWPSAVVARKAVKEFTGGTASGKSLANEDSRGTGIDGRFLMCGQTVYPKEALVAWLKTKAATGWRTRKTAAA